MISRWAALIAGAVIGVTLVALVVIELDRRNASPIEIVIAERSNLIRAEIAGAVVSPGVYDLRRGDRVIDLIDKAGGLLPTADPSTLNLAADVVDGEKVTIPDASRSAEAGSSASPVVQHLVDLNRATTADLITLPGIGDVRADAIVAYRNQHGPFRNVDELTLVDGISAVLVESLRPYVTVGS